MSQNKRYIPLNAGESAVLPDANTLLPRDEVYEPLAQMIIEAVNKAEAATGRSLNQLREHNAISIDGERGTGKTAVLVNLKSYLDQEKHKHILNKVHILDPVDPTLLENGESLFLHIVVAAVLHDKDVKEQQRNKPDKARSLNQTLEKLAQSLESVETQQDRYGMDKIRAMFSNKQLADCVQDFFREVLGLLGKQLLILPMDDVDTSLNRAFENLEIVRRYLATPYVLPIVCGDRSLYDEVTWRDFHGRLTEDSKHLSDTDAYQTAKELAKEYQRKILPVPRRLTMPPISQYWLNPEIRLGSESNEAMPLRNFISWLEIFLAGPVNGLGDSQLPLPIPSMRALTQLLNRCHQLIPSLPKSVRDADSALQVKRAWQMPDVPAKAIEEFEKEYQKRYTGDKREYGSAYAKFAEFAKQPTASDTNLSGSNVDRKAWVSSLEKHFKYEAAGGVAYLVLQAKQHWQQWQCTETGQRSGSVFDTPLFQPRMHGNVSYQDFERNHDLTDWEDSLKNKLPKAWFRDLSGLKTILPYPLAEVGCNINRHLQKQVADSRKENNQNWLAALDNAVPDLASNEQLSRKAGLLLNLLAEHYFYNPAQRTVVLNIGRIFELIITSLLGDVELNDLQRILHSPPFFSAKSQAQDIAISGQEDAIDDESKTSEDSYENKASPLDLALSDLQQAIEQWRKDHAIAQLDISPWLIYKVFEKVYSMISDSNDYRTGLSALAGTINKAGVVFYATWSAFGNFEKGRLFGLPELVTGVSLLKTKNFESNDHFKINIGHLAPRNNQLPLPDMKASQERKYYGAATKSITYVLADHPLKKWIDEISNLGWDGASTTSSVPDTREKTEPKVGQASKPKAWLCNKLGLESEKKLTEINILKAIENWSIDNCHKLAKEMESEYPKATERNVLQKALNNKYPGQF
ncbi:TPA: antiviral RADAR system adenosine triphosphatase RdrA [Aeromonas hydrophila]